MLEIIHGVINLLKKKLKQIFRTEMHHNLELSTGNTQNTKR